MYLKVTKLTKPNVKVEVDIDKHKEDECFDIWFSGTDNYIALTLQEAEQLHAKLAQALQEYDEQV